jgi:prepilin-type N-terminal cleavage/methylation domain-containing protein
MKAAAAGFSLIELLVAMAIMVTFTTALLSLVVAGQMFARTQPEAADLQQRARIALQTLGADLAMAGAGVDRGPLAGSLARFFPPVEISADAGITIWYAASRPAQTTLAAPLAIGQIDAAVRPAFHCPASDPGCTFAPGTTAIVFDGAGCRDVLRVDVVTPAALLVRAGSRRCAYGPDAAVAEGEVRTYRVDPATRQLLRRDEATGATVPVLDNVSAMRVEFLDGQAHIRVTLRLIPAIANPLVPEVEVTCDLRPSNLQPR